MLSSVNWHFVTSVTGQHPRRVFFFVWHR